MTAVAPVDAATPQTNLPFPFDIRLMMVAWNFLFLDGQPFAPDASKSAEWNRGAYSSAASPIAAPAIRP